MAIAAPLIDTLIGTEAKPCVSIYLGPTAAGRGDERRLRLRALLDRAEESLESWILTAGARINLVEPLRQALQAMENEGTPRAGEAFFRNADLFQRLGLPDSVADGCFVGDEFYVKPLFTLCDSDESYYIIAISQQAVRLYRADRHKIAEVLVPGLPENLADVVPARSLDGQLQMHTGRPELHGKEGGVFFGHGGAEADHKGRLLSFVRAIDAALHSVLRTEHAPLLFAGVDYLFPLYREANTYAGLLTVPLNGNPDRQPPKELHQQSLDAVASHLNPERLRDAKTIAEGGSRICKGILWVLPAAFAGQVESLFVACDEQLWGRCNNDASQIQLDHEPLLSSVDLLDVAAKAVYRHGGRVYAVPRQQIPGGTQIVSLLRYV